MKKFLILFSGVLLAGCTVPGIGRKNSGIKVIAAPSAAVSMDGKQIGNTPLEIDSFPPGKHQIRLTAAIGLPWESEITLNPNLQTVVERTFAAGEEESEGYIMTLEKTASSQEPQISIITVPDRAIIRLDGQPKGFAPVSAAISPNTTHEITISSAGYKEKQISVQAPPQHRLNLNIQLARAPLIPSVEEEPSPTPTASGETSPAVSPPPTGTQVKGVNSSPPVNDRPYVEILDTPTGWLRVRSEPNTGQDNEIAKVKPGETYRFLTANDSGWYEIKLSETKEGWISGRYAKLYE